MRYLEEPQRKAWNKKTVFIAAMAVGVVVLLISTLATRGESLYNIFFVSKTDTYMDFFNSIYDTDHDLYGERGVIYPAMNYLAYRFFACCFTEEALLTGSVYMANSLLGKMYVLAFLLIGLSLLRVGTTGLMHDDSSKNVALWLAVVLSAPVIYLLERGNMMLLTVAGTALFLAYKDSENAGMRLFSYIALAFAACTKIYPALFGLLLLKERRYKDAFICILLGLAFFVLPFFIIAEISDIPVMIDNILHNTNASSTNGFGQKLNIRNSLQFFDYLLHTSALEGIAGKMMPLCLLILTPQVFIFRTYWKRVLVLSLICIAAPDFSYMYTATLLIPALVLFLQAKRSKYDGAYMACFLLLFLPWPFPLPAAFSFMLTGLRLEVTIQSLLGSLAILGMCCMTTVEAVRLFAVRYRKWSDEKLLARYADIDWQE